MPFEARTSVTVLGAEEPPDRGVAEADEGVVGRGEDREGAVALERLDEPSGLDGGDERLESVRRRGDLGDVAAVLGGGRKRKGEEDEGGRRRRMRGGRG
jgi:hypothetical protein